MPYTPPGAPGFCPAGISLDPTANVISLVQAETRRQDDLRIAHQNLQAQEILRLDDLAKLREQHAAELRIAESARIDAIRAVDQGNVTRASEVAAAQATALASQLQVSAEALRAQVEATRITTADTLAAALSPIQNDVSVLREVQFRQQGEKGAVTDQHDLRNDTRNFVVALMGVLILAAVLIAPHIH